MAATSASSEVLLSEEIQLNIEPASQNAQDLETLGDQLASEAQQQAARVAHAARAAQARAAALTAAEQHNRLSSLQGQQEEGPPPEPASRASAVDFPWVLDAGPPKS
jgi:hypothetical protein